MLLKELLQLYTGASNHDYFQIMDKSSNLKKGRLIWKKKKNPPGKFS